MPEDLDLSSPRPLYVSQRLRTFGAFASISSGVLAGIGITTLAAAAPRIGMIAVYNSGLACLLGSIMMAIAAGMTRQIRHLVHQLIQIATMENQTERALHGILGGVDDELEARRRAR